MTLTLEQLKDRVQAYVILNVMLMDLKAELKSGRSLAGSMNEMRQQAATEGLWLGQR